MTDADKERIMHISLPIGDGAVLMGTDSLESLGQKLTLGNNFYICLSPDTKEEADKLFNGLSAGGKIEMPIQDMFWGAYWGSFTDKFGVQWMINYHKNRT
jgi:PhnB protein